MKASTKTILGLLLSSFLGAFPLLAETKSKHKYFPKDKEELLRLVEYESVKLDEIDTSKITDMSYLFCEEKNDARANGYDVYCGMAVREEYKGIEKWDVSNVESMESMFRGNEKFNEPIGSWDVSNVKDMQFMFRGATSFNQPLEKWNVSKVENMGAMFSSAISFNQPLDKWDVSKVKNMGSMFRNATSFNQPLDSWDVSNVKYMGGMFEGAISFNQLLGKWDVSKIELMYEMFYNAKSFNQDLSKWDLRKADVGEMFEGATSMNPDWLPEKIKVRLKILEEKRKLNEAKNHSNLSK